MPKVEVKLDLSRLGLVHQAACDSAFETVLGLHNEIVADQVVPMDVGTLQGSMGATDQFEEGDDTHTTLCIGDTPYARRLYFHPEYNFQTVNNPNAQGLWAEHWLPGGDKEDFAPDTFRQRMEERLK